MAWSARLACICACLDITFGTMKSLKPCRHTIPQRALFHVACASFCARGSGFNQKERLDLQNSEIDADKELKSMSKLLDSYLFHRAVSAHQKPLPKDMLDRPALDSLFLLVDFMELLTLRDCAPSVVRHVISDGDRSWRKRKRRKRGSWPAEKGPRRSSGAQWGPPAA